MQINRKHFPEILLDNEERFFSSLAGVIESVDEFSNVEITKLSNAYLFRIAPSSPQYINSLIEEIIKFHNLFDIQLSFSKSIKASSVINFEICL